MNWPAFADLLYELLPGFIAAGVFYVLTAYRRPPLHDQLLFALVLTMIVKGLVVVTRGGAVAIGSVLVLGEWSADLELVISIVLGTLLGFVLAWAANNDWPLRLLRGAGPRALSWIEKLEITRKTIRPSEWYTAMSENDSWVILHLADERRLMGYPAEWPDEHDRGHFILRLPEWLPDGETAIDMADTATMLVPAHLVEFVEFVDANKKQELIDDAGEAESEGRDNARRIQPQGAAEAAPILQSAAEEEVT